jgi:hypothetical protein
MELINATKLVAEYSTATDKTGREWLVVVAKATYGFPSAPSSEPVLLDDQVPLIMTDQFTGEAGFSAVRYESDFAPRKLRCDVLLNGSCYAPHGRPAKQVTVGVRVGQVLKVFSVVGNRIWQSGALFGVAPGEPAPFTVMPFSYDNAYGGVDQPTPDPATHSWYLTNPAGLGFRPGLATHQLKGQRLPNTEQIGNPIRRHNGDYKPMAFGPIGRSWQQRIKWAGTYDDQWMRHQYPFLPNDFDEHYFQTAPDDQQTHHLVGGERLLLVNLSPEGRVEFTLPKLSEPVTVHYKNGNSKRLVGAVDTLFLEPDLGRFTLTLRTSVQLRRNLHELRSVELGKVLPQPLPENGEQQRPVMKPHYKSLGEFIAARMAAKR